MFVVPAVVTVPVVVVIPVVSAAAAAMGVV